MNNAEMIDYCISELGFSSDELAKRLKLTVQQIYDIKDKKCSPDKLCVKRIKGCYYRKTIPGWIKTLKGMHKNIIMQEYFINASLAKKMAKTTTYEKAFNMRQRYYKSCLPCQSPLTGFLKYAHCETPFNVLHED